MLKLVIEDIPFNMKGIKAGLKERMEKNRARRQSGEKHIFLKNFGKTIDKLEKDVTEDDDGEEEKAKFIKTQEEMQD